MLLHLDVHCLLVGPDEWQEALFDSKDAILDKYRRGTIRT
jgi:hypothetical protein